MSQVFLAPGSQWVGPTSKIHTQMGFPIAVPFPTKCCTSQSQTQSWMTSRQNPWFPTLPFRPFPSSMRLSSQHWRRCRPGQWTRHMANPRCLPHHSRLRTSQYKQNLSQDFITFSSALPNTHFAGRRACTPSYVPLAHLKRSNYTYSLYEFFVLF